MSFRTLVIVAAGGSLALLLAAWGFQYLGGLTPCKMCIWQRWPHGVAVVVGLLLLAVGWRPLALLGALAAAASAAIGIFHTGVERGWWEGPTSCTGTGAGLGSVSGESLLSLDDAAPLVMCDQVAWELLGLSMASWNAAASAALAFVWILAWRARV